MNIDTTCQPVTAEELQNVTGGRMILPHTRLENELTKKIKGNAGNVSDYVGEFGVEGRIPYVGK